jgi:hypothetical protein
MASSSVCLEGRAPAAASQSVASSVTNYTFTIYILSSHQHVYLRRHAGVHVLVEFHSDPRSAGQPRMTLAATQMAGRQLSRRLAFHEANRLSHLTCSSRRECSPRRRLAVQVKAAAAEAPSKESVMIADPHNNVSENIYNKLGVNLHRQKSHPLGTIREAIYEYFDKQHKDSFNKFDDLLPIVSVQSNFDSVLVPADHVSRSLNDTYYVDANTVLRYSPLCIAPMQFPFLCCKHSPQSGYHR